MANTRKALILIVIVAALLCVAISRTHHSEQTSSQYIKLEGMVFHTFYHITYQGDDDLHTQIKTLFNEFDGSLSMFNDTSIISRMNNNDTTVRANSYFHHVFEKAQTISRITHGDFDITVAPLVNLWGFGFKNSDTVTPKAVDSILQFVGYQSVNLDHEGRLHKQDPRTILDASSIAKGYMSDVVAQFLETQGIQNYMVEIGGEIALKGVNPRGKAWTVGISRPIADSLQIANTYQDYIHLTQGGLATSGNYRNFYDKGGKRYAHTINPHTGYPIQRDVLSATVIASDCMTADAFATSFMVMGSEKALQILSEQEGIEGYLILPSSTDSTQLEVVYSEGFASYLTE